MWPIAAMTVLALLASGCKDEAPAKRYACTCAFLTDTDDTSTQKVEICETSAERAQSAATGCAQSAAPAPIQSCACEPLPGSCRAGDCAVREHR